MQGVQQLAGWLAQTAPLYAPDCRSAPAAGGGSVDLMNQTLDELQRRIDDALQLRAAAADFLARLRTADHRHPQTAKGLFTARRRDGPGTSFGPVRYDTRSYFKVTCAQRPTKLQPLQPFNGLFSRTTWVSRYQKGKTNLDFTGAIGSEWQWHPLCHMQVCTSLQTDNHASTPPLCFLQAGCPSCRPTNSVKALKAIHTNTAQ